MPFALAVVVALAALAVVTTPAAAQVAGPPSGDGVQPVFTVDNPTCADLDPGTTELKVEPVADGTFTDGFLIVTIDVRDTADGPVFDFTSNIGIDSVFVKGGPDGNFYNYQDTIGENSSDTDLHAPVNPSSGDFFGLSHISFCYDVTASVEVEKTGDELSKVGDDVTYEFEIENTGDVPLTLQSVTDTLLGDLTPNAIAAGCGTLAASTTCGFSVVRTVQSGDPDPLPNTVTVVYSGTLPSGATTVSDSDTHSVNLFQPSVTIDKTGDTLSKVGDEVGYTITITNTSSNDSPNLTCDVSDDVLGTLDQDVELAPGEDHTINETRTVQSGDPDPLVNTATVDCQVAGFPNTVTDSDTHSVNLFQPSVQIVKTGPAEATEGQTITYSFTITNTGSSDSPNLVLDSVIDSRLGNLTATATANGCGNLAPSASCTFTRNFTIAVGTPSPLVNVVTARYHPTGFPNEVKDDDDHSVVVQPAAPAQGCTPGFWKNHPNAWGPTGYSRNQTLESVFDVPNVFGLDNNTLLEALSFKGGSGNTAAARILLRSAVAALLNAAHPSINYPRTPAGVIADVNAALASNNRGTMIRLKDQLDRDNNAGCSINGQMS